MPLIDSAIKNAKPSTDNKPIKLADGNSLFLWIMPNGAKYWRMSYRFEGKQKNLDK
ncbi:Arm DNA-binding domain-containing protein [Neisseriaceae bacterium TC5R-5]|nr:Arm DNA-binding domain-containing protein [Neisseriaceae bacterium TC5R-5]